jgi:hypothetical protein
MVSSVIGNLKMMVEANMGQCGLDGLVDHLKEAGDIR